MTTIHVIKTSALWFDAIHRGDKTAELRLDDRNYAVDDMLELIEIDFDLAPTGRSVNVRISHIMTASDGPWLKSGMVMLSFDRRRHAPPAVRSAFHEQTLQRIARSIGFA